MNVVNRAAAASATAAKRPGDPALLGLLASDLFGAAAAAIIHVTMVWWVLAQNPSPLVFSCMVLAIFLPLNFGILISGVAVARVGARRLLIASKTLALCGAAACALLLHLGAMSLWSLALVAAITYASMGPSMSADLARAPALLRLSRRRLARFNAANGIVLVLGNISGVGMAGALAEHVDPARLIGTGILLVAVSLALTWASFPRDRLRLTPRTSLSAHFGDLVRAVLERIDDRRLGMTAVLMAAAIITTAEVASEVILPLFVRDAGLSSGDYAVALVAAITASMIAAIATQAVHGKIELTLSLLLLATMTTLATGLAAVTGGWIAMLVLVATTAAAAMAAGILTFTTLQERMPVSLQAQAAGLWQNLLITVGAGAILASGLLGAHAVAFLVFLAGLAVLAGLMRHRPR